MREFLGRVTSAINNSVYSAYFSIILTVDFNTINLQAFFSPPCSSYTITWLVWQCQMMTHTGWEGCHIESGVGGAVIT